MLEERLDAEVDVVVMLADSVDMPEKTLAELPEVDVLRYVLAVAETPEESELSWVLPLGVEK